jgi:adenylyltransferase/sulfurtransferase
MKFPDPEQCEELSPRQLDEIRSEGGEFDLIDCREQDEWDFCRLENARHFALSEFAVHAASLLAMKDKPTVIYCHHGMRSLHATRWLRQHGRQNVFSLAGGIQRWSDEIDPQVPTY